MAEVSTNEHGLLQQEQQNYHENNSQRLLTCFRILFDRSSFDDIDSAFRGVSAFKSPFEVVVPLMEPLQKATLGKLMSSFVSHVSCRFPEFSQRTLDAFFISPNADGCGASVTENWWDSDSRLLLRIDASVNRDDTLDNFFLPSTSTGMMVYNLIAQWSTNEQKNNAELNYIAKEDQSSKQRDSETDERTQLKEVSDTVKPITAINVKPTALPEPVIYPFAQRCAYARLLPRSATPNNEDCPSYEEVDPRCATMLASIARKNEIRNARRVFESGEQSARQLLMAEEHVARNELREWQEGDLRQVLALLRLADKNVPACGVSVDFFPKPVRRYPVDTQPLATFPSSEYINDLTAVAEETAWISHIFANMPVFNAASDVADKKMKEIIATKDEVYAKDSEYAEAFENLWLHYLDFRRDLLTWERRTFYALTNEMKLFLERQKQLDEEFMQTAFHEELEDALVFDFRSYEHQYGQRCSYHIQASGTQDRPANSIFDEHNESNSVRSLFYAQPEKNDQPAFEQESSVNVIKSEEEEVASMMATVAAETNAAEKEEPGISHLSSFTMQQLLASSEPNCDEYFRSSLNDSRARVKAALETIFLIDMRWQEPVAFKLAKQRLSFNEKEARNKIISDEEEERKKLSQCAEEEKLEWQRYDLFAYTCLIDPVVTIEAQERKKICGEQVRHLALLNSLFCSGIKQLGLLQFSSTRCKGESE